jgi:RNA polymerase sigma factor (sigma-70 family)
MIPRHACCLCAGQIPQSSGQPSCSSVCSASGSVPGLLNRRCATYASASSATPSSSPGCTASRSTRPTAARRANRPRARLALDQRPVDLPDRGESPHLRAERSDRREALERAIRALEPNYRAPLILRDIEGLSTAEAAMIMNLGEAAFKSRLHRARLAVRDAIDGYLPKDDA